MVGDISLRPVHKLGPTISEPKRQWLGAVPLLEFDIVSKFLIHRNLELWIYRNIEWVCPSIPWHPRVLMQILNESFDARTKYRNRIVFVLCLSVSYRTRFRYRYLVELDSDIGIVSNSIPISVSYRTRFRYRYRIELESDIGIVLNSIPISVSYRHHIELDSDIDAIPIYKNMTRSE